MKILSNIISAAFLFIVLGSTTGCDSSSDVVDGTKLPRAVSPKVGSLFFYSSYVVDSLGEKNNSANYAYADSIIKVGSEYDGKSNVTVAEYSRDYYHYTNYEPNGDISLYQYDWHTVPIETKETKYYVQKDEVTGGISMREYSITLTYDSVVVVTVGNSQYKCHQISTLEKLKVYEIADTTNSSEGITPGRIVFSPTLGCIMEYTTYATRVDGNYSYDGKSYLIDSIRIH